MIIISGVFLILVLWTAPGTSLLCYTCNCALTDTAACDCSNVTDAAAGDHCIVTKNFDPSNSYAALSTSSYSLDPSDNRIIDAFYIFTDESIYYNETSEQWETKIDQVDYGCDWDNCNTFDFIAALPNSFGVNINSTWLNQNIYSNGSVVTSCNNCSNGICGNETNPIDYNLCPSTSCDNSTTCSLRDIWYDANTKETCYQSECTPQSTDESNEKYYVGVEAIVYLAQNRSNVGIWQLDINCGIENCDRPTIFQEIETQFQATPGDLSAFPTGRPSPTATTISPTVPATTMSPTVTTTTLPDNVLYCYSCSCTGATCPCTNTEANSADRSYCSITRSISGQNLFITYGHIFINASFYYAREYPYVLISESITYDQSSGQWNTQPEYVIYGCNWNFCNRPELVPYITSSFVMRLPESWLNSNILGTGQPTRDCHECTDGTVCSNSSFIDNNLCPIQTCNTTCLLGDRFPDPTGPEQCYESYCASDLSDETGTTTARVDIEAILYPSTLNTVEVWEIDIYCRADNCTRPGIFDDIRSNLSVVTGDLTIIFNQTGELPKLRCFDCYCVSDQNCTCDTVSAFDTVSTFCIIGRTDDGTNINITFSSANTDTAYTNIREYPFVLSDESILYDNTTGLWNTRMNEIVYGCNWDYCNRLALLASLPTSLQATPPATWLNATILGTGQPLQNCYNCNGTEICSFNSTIESSLCLSQACDTACYLQNSIVNSTTNEQCYQSSCAAASSYEALGVEIKSVVYANQPTIVEYWEINAHCQVDNCSSPEVLQEITQNLPVQANQLSAIFNQTNSIDPDQLSCYNCYCVDDPICACNEIVTLPAGETYCTIVRYYQGQHVFITLEHIDRNSSAIYIRDFPLMLFEESILYDENTGQWNTRPTLVMFGCNTNYCNDPRLVPRLPISFEMRLPETWLNSSILGTGQPVRDCHECPNTTYCGTTDFLDASRCPIQACNTTCFVAEVFEDPEGDEFCYQSYCLPPDAPEDELSGHRVEIEGIIYGNIPNASLEFWGIEIYCRADNCSDPEIFQQLQAQLEVNIGDLSAFFNTTVVITTTTTLATTTTTTATTTVAPTITCYDCTCFNDPICSCNTFSEATGSYCTILRQNFGDQGFSIILEHVQRNSTQFYVREFPYLLTEETIFYNQTFERWFTRTDIVLFGCNTSYCNNPSLVPYLPDSFQMTLPDSWLNTNVLGTGQPVRECHECPDAPQCGTLDFLDPARCPIQTCNTTCLVSDTFDIPENNQQCYQSFCAQPDVGFIEIDPPRVILEGILYLYPPGRQVELWEIDIFCRADDCSRPEIFYELTNQLNVTVGNVTIFYPNITTPTTTATTAVTTTPGGPSITCYDCACFDDPNCSCNTFSNAIGSYCTIIRQNFGDQGFAIVLEHIRRNSTRVYVREFPYILTEETILYNETTGRWFTRTDLVTFGCNTSFCNNPSLVPYLPDSFQMTLPDSWLNTNVLGTGQPVRNCHECPDAPQCGTLDFLDPSRCPIQACNTTCLVSDTFDIPENNQQCYQSFCAPPDSEFFTIDPHRVILEGILYLNPPGRQVELWEIDIFCRADDCSRPEIFYELTNQLNVTVGNVTIFYPDITTPTTPSTTTATTAVTTTPGGPSITCYDCACFDDPNCSCNTFSNAVGSYCTIIRQNFGDQGFIIVLEHIQRNSSRVYIREFPYILTEETILYNETTGRWFTRTDLVTFGCNTSYCNNPSLVPYLPDSFQMTLPDSWLNTNVLGTGQPVRNCHECPDAPQCGTLDFLDPARCPIQACNTTCLVSDTFDIPENNQQCYQSFCAPPDSEFFTIDPHRVVLEGILYLNPPGRQVELWEIDIFCRADDCSRPEIFYELTNQLNVTVGNVTIFYTNVTTTTPTTSTTATVAVSTTTSASTSIYMGSIVLIFCFFAMILFNRY